MGTDVEPRSDLTPVLSEQEEQALAEQIKGDIDTADIVVPMLKLAQGQSKEVQAGDAEVGDFVNSLTGENFGNRIEFIVADTFSGRFWRDDDDRVHTAQGDTVPWPDHDCYGKHFADCPDAEETFKEAVNNGEREWGRGPAISTTHNFVGFVVGEEGSAVPVRLSLMRTNVPAAQKLKTFISRLSRAPWDNVYVLTSEARTGRGKPFVVVTAERGRVAEPVERNAAVQLALSMRGDGTKVEFHEAEEAEPDEKPADREGGLEV